MNEPQFGQFHNVGGHSFAKYRTDMICPRCGYFTEAEGSGVSDRSIALKCRRCSGSVLVQFDKHLASADKNVVDYWPKHTPTVDAFVPQEIAKDYLEAQRCFSGAAWHGCAVMARRCMHQVVERFQASGKDLYQQIDDLRQKQIITPVLADAAQQVRALGKHGAHPYDTKGNPFTELETEDARAALEFCDLIFDQVFVQPEKIKASRSRAK